MEVTECVALIRYLERRDVTGSVSQEGRGASD